MSIWNVVVIDDRCRFPLHVWRYLSRSLGIGVGEVGDDGRSIYEDAESEPWISRNSPLSTDDGGLKLWWVLATDGLEARIDNIVKDSRPQDQWMFLVDVHGERSSRYNAEKVGNYLGSLRLDLVWYPVSAYYSGNNILEKDVLPKTRETLKKIRDIVYKNKPERPARRPENVRHVLVTGAGFEIGSRLGGFGLPSTRTLLREMGDIFRPDPKGAKESGPIYLGLREDEEGERNGKGNKKRKGALPGFFIPVSGIWEDDKDCRKRISMAAEIEDLDDYWDILLGEELRSKIGSLAKHEVRDSNKAEALIRETRMREAFRSSLLKHDWGHMNQSLAAADLGWSAWLTTNYTQFSNRAIAVYGTNEELGSWRIIATAAEARVTLRESLGNTAKSRRRYLFKLHGDIGHLHTMAIAGHDKDIFSPLSMPVEDLYQVYESAQTFLLSSFSNRKPGLVIWHIVGHGLQDRRLCNLLGKVNQQSEAQHRFVLVNPNAKKPNENLTAALKPKGGEIEVCKLRAAPYMARLRAADLLSSSDPQDVQKWIKEITASS